MIYQYGVMLKLPTGLYWGAGERNQDLGIQYNVPHKSVQQGVRQRSGNPFPEKGGGTREPLFCIIDVHHLIR